MLLTTNFAISEFACKTKPPTPVPEQFICNVQKVAAQLQILRDHIGQAIHITSAYRTPAYNKSVGGSPKSQHLTASAADIWVKGMTPVQLAAVVERLIAEKKLTFGGIGIYKTFVHVDIRKTRTRWNG
jgi:uncharacterized protein YcbK (DUF882 family)